MDRDTYDLGSRIPVLRQSFQPLFQSWLQENWSHHGVRQLSNLSPTTDVNMVNWTSLRMVSWFSTNTSVPRQPPKATLSSQDATRGHHVLPPSASRLPEADFQPFSLENCTLSTLDPAATSDQYWLIISISPKNSELSKKTKTVTN